MSKLLIIDDDQLVANIYRNKFTVEGYTVEIALDGEAGLELIESFRPDALLLDLVLPKISGVELLRRIRSVHEQEKLPVIVFSNTYLSNTVQEAWKAGATKCLSKSSCTPKQLLQVVRECLNPSPAQIEPAVEQETEPAAAVNGEDQSASQQVRADFLASLPATLTILRGILQAVVRAPDAVERAKKLDELHRKFHLLSANAGVAGLRLVAQFSEAAEALIRELIDKPAEVNPSTLRTLAGTVDFIGWLFQFAAEPGRQELGEPKILVVDDDPLSRRAVCHSVQKVHLSATGIEDPLFAIKMAAQNRYDLIILDVDMPEMSGFELCSKLRTTQMHNRTPIVFVTSLTDFESRANSTISGGNDLIAKPFLFMELGVKALTNVIRSRLTLQN